MLLVRSVPPFMNIPDAAVAPVYCTDPGTTVMPPPSKLVTSVCTAAGEPLLADRGLTMTGLAHGHAAPSTAAIATKSRIPARRSRRKSIIPPRRRLVESRAPAALHARAGTSPYVKV